VALPLRLPQLLILLQLQPLRLLTLPLHHLLRLLILPRAEHRLLLKLLLLLALVGRYSPLFCG